KPLKPYCYNDGKVNLNFDADPTIKDIIFSSRIPGLVTKLGSIYWFNTPILDPTKSHNIMIRKEYTDPITLCYKQDSFLIRILDNPLVKVQDQTFCQDKGEFELSSGDAAILIFPNQANKGGGLRTWTVLNKDGVPPPPVIRNDGTPFDAKWIFDPG